MHCSRCGSNIALNSAACPSCGLHVRIQKVTPLQDETTKIAARAEDPEEEQIEDELLEDDELPDEDSRIKFWLRAILVVLCTLTLISIGVLIGKYLFSN
jgi:hypothetical protein